MKKKILCALLILVMILSMMPAASAALVSNTEHWKNLDRETCKALDFPNKDCYIVLYYSECGYSKKWVPAFQKRAEEMGIMLYGLEETEKADLELGDLLKDLCRGTYPVIIELSDGKKYSYPSVHSLADFERIVTGNGKRYEGDYLIQMDKVAAYLGKERDVVIPETLGVKAIRQECFFKRDDIRSVTVPEGVTTIECYAFSSCRALKEVHLPASLTLIEENAFLNCYGSPTLYFKGNQPRIEGNYTFGGKEATWSIYGYAAVLPEGKNWNVAALSAAHPYVNWGAKPGQIYKMPSAADFNAANIDAWAIPYVAEAISYGLRPNYLKMFTMYKNYPSREFFCSIAMNLLYTLIGEYSPEIQNLPKENPFTDTKQSWVIQAYHLGIVNGKSADKFEPNAKITRQEAACMLQRVGEYLGLKSGETPMTFTDGEAIAPWAKGAVDYVTSAGIMNGIGEKFDPHGMYTLQQAYTTFLRMYKNIVGIS